MKSLKVQADDLLDLLDEYDAAAGLLSREEQEEHRARFSALRAKVEAAVKEAENMAARNYEFGRGYNAARNGQSRNLQKEGEDWYKGYDTYKLNQIMEHSDEEPTS